LKVDQEDTRGEGELIEERTVLRVRRLEAKDAIGVA
jgi:hypothetical protein